MAAPEEDVEVVWEGELPLEGTGPTKCRLIRFGGTNLEAQYWVGERKARINPFTRQPIEFKRGPWEHFTDPSAQEVVYSTVLLALLDARDKWVPR